MTDYNLKPGMLPSLVASEAKEKRRKVLEEARKRRKIIYQKFRAKRSRQTLQQSTSTLEGLDKKQLLTDIM